MTKNTAERPWGSAYTCVVQHSSHEVIVVLQCILGSVLNTMDCVFLTGKNLHGERWCSQRAL